MLFSGLFAPRYPPPIPCIAPLYCLCLPNHSKRNSLMGRTLHISAGISPSAGSPNTVFLHKETFGSPKFPSYPFEHMPWSKTPVVSFMLAISHIGLLPSAQSKASAFLPHSGSYPNDHNYTFFGAQYRAYTLVPSSFVLPLPGLHVDFSTEPVANLYSGGTFTHWVTISSFIPIYVDSQGFGLTLARELALLVMHLSFKTL